MKESHEKKAVSAEKSAVAKREEETLAFWREARIFEKQNEARKDAPEFTFYDGPPFATGTPHYGHLLAGTLKDAIPRFEVMRGKRVRRQWGWDCHGLPLENLIEKELGLKTKKDIEELGVGKFNAAARSAVLRYEHEWKKVVPRMGRFVDMENPYATMDSSYTETIWWIFKNLFDKGLIYKGFKSMHICPRCETTLSNFEVNQGYKDITDISVTVKFELADAPNTFLLAWTTTPWTLPGNAALAVNPELEYVKVRCQKKKPLALHSEPMGGEPSPEKNFIFAKERFSVLKEKIEADYVIHDEKVISASELVGKAYKPVFDYYQNAKFTHPDHAWKVYSAPFVTADDGTGIVHIAPAFGSDDLALAQKNHIPPIHHVGMDGRFKKEIGDGLAGKLVKPKGEAGEKDAHQKTDVEIIKLLAAKGALFAKEKLVHSYPHCWRCETPLLNYATTSWFVKVSAIKEKLVEENKKITWIPNAVGEYRFGNWLEGAPDWAISRARYWGAPLPVWVCEDLETIEAVGSLEELKAKTRSSNKYFVVRHGEAENNVNAVMSVRPDAPHHLTEKGRGQAREAGSKLVGKQVDAIIASPFLRTRETAEIIAKEIGFDPSKIIFDDRIREISAPPFDGKAVAEWQAACHVHRHHFTQMPEGCEGYKEVKRRMGEFLYDIDKKYSGKNIVIVSHDSPIWLLVTAAEGLTELESLALRGTGQFFSANAQVRELSFAPIPHNQNFELDFHRPFIDEVEYVSGGKKMRRIPEVFDCWFESGSMPYGQFHYMGKTTAEFCPEKEIGFPADFIAEGLDQTRGWFYSLLVLGVALFGKSPYKSVVVNGLVLAEDGQKMSKSKQNYPDPMAVVDRYGADAVRYYLLSSPAVHADDFAFTEKGVDEVLKKHIQRLENVCSFYEMYADKEAPADSKRPASKNILDRWVLARLDQTALEVTAGFEKFETDRAARPIAELIDDLSTWYLRRSRDRFKVAEDADHTDKDAALATTRYLLIEFSKLIAPFMPFLAESVYRRMGGPKESVHLENWPEAGKPDEAALFGMKEVRLAVTLALEARAKANVKVRQPLQKVTLRGGKLSDELAALVKDEVNVKEVAFNKDIDAEVELDAVITPELREEGEMRELVRAIQDARKEAKLDAKDKKKLVATVSEKDAEILKKFEKEICTTCNLSGTEINVGSTRTFIFA